MQHLSQPLHNGRKKSKYVCIEIFGKWLRHRGRPEAMLQQYTVNTWTWLVPHRCLLFLSLPLTTPLGLSNYKLPLNFSYWKAKLLWKAFVTNKPPIKPSNNKNIPFKLVTFYHFISLLVPIKTEKYSWNS